MEFSAEVYVCKPDDLRMASNAAANNPIPTSSTTPCPTLPNNVIEIILKEVPSQDRKQMRLINRVFNSSFICSPSLHKDYIFTVDGSTRASGYASLQTLISSSVHWQHIRFKRFPLEAQLLGNEIGFLFFTRSFCSTLKSLTFQNCKMRMGRFIELLTFCENLTHLHILNCGSLFIASFEILHWEPFYKKFFQILERLQGLEIVEVSNKLTEEGLLSWTSKTKNLQSLKIHTGMGGKKFPKWAVIQAILNCRDSLIELDIFGACADKPTFWEIILKKQCDLSKFESLTLKVKLHPGNTVSEVFGQLRSLKNLDLNHAKIPENCFANINQSLPSLERITLKYCIILPVVLDRLAECETIKSLTFKCNLTASDSFKVLDGYTEFFKNTKSPLEEVTFFAPGGARIIPLIVENRPNLKNLDISGITGIDRCDLLLLNHLKLTNTSLKIIGCEVFFASLSAPETLDLSEPQLE